MKILLLSQWFEPEPVFKGLLFAKELASLGHEVTVLTGFPNYPGGVLYPGYRIRPWLREEREGIRIVRVALYPSHDNSSAGRVLNYVSFALAAAVLGTALVETPDIVYVYHPPATIAIAAMVIGFFHRVPFVYDIQDLWPDSIAVSGMMSNRIVLRLLDAWCALAYHCARKITVLSPGLQKRLIERGVPREKVDVVYNWCDAAAMTKRDAPPGDPAARKRFTVLFAGTMGHAQDLESVLQAARICRDSAPAAEFFFVGGGVERQRLENLATEMELTNVSFFARQPMEAMGGILADADALLVHLKDDPLFHITIPSKVQAYLAAGKPILLAVSGDAADLILRSGAGIVCRPGDPQSIADAVKQLAETDPERLAAMGRAGEEFYAREMSITSGVRRFEKIFKEVLQGIDG